MRFLVHGSIAYDILQNFDGSFIDAMDPQSLEKLSVSYVMPHLKRHYGGTGANIAWNLQLLGHDAVLTGTVGTDGDEYIERLNEKGVNTDNVVIRDDAVTAVATIGTDTSERQIAFFHPGADAITPLPKTVPSDISYGIVSPRNPLRMLEAATAMKEANIPFLFDPGQLAHVFSETDFRRSISDSSGLVVNEYEWSLVQRKASWKEEDVLEAAGMLIITLGENGMRLVTREEDVSVPACKVQNVMNPTGAGDAARAGLLIGLASKWDLQKTGELATAISSFIVEQEGTQLDTLDQNQLETRMKH